MLTKCERPGESQKKKSKMLEAQNGKEKEKKKAPLLKTTEENLKKRQNKALQLHKALAKSKETSCLLTGEAA